MKKFIFGLFLVSLCVLNTACTKENYTDSFVGTYLVSTIENVTWGNDSGTLTNSGVLRIDKVSNNRVKASGYFDTYGEVIGSSLYLDSYTVSDYAGTSTITFGTGMLAGNVLTLTSTSSGILDNYAYFSAASHTCIKQ